MNSTKTKLPVKTVVIIAVTAIVLLFAIVLSFFLFKKISLQQALKKLDIEDYSSIVSIMKKGASDKNAVMTIIDSYIDNNMNTDAAQLLLYYLQYIDKDDAIALEKLKKCYLANGASEVFISQFDNADFNVNDFKITTQYEQNGYGISNGIYVSFLDGYAKAKISGIIPRSISAGASGVYALDSSDMTIKLIRRDGSVVQTVINDKVKEFVFFESYIYYIDQSGVPHGVDGPIQTDGLIAMNLRVDGERVICTLYDNDYNEIKELQL